MSIRTSRIAFVVLASSAWTACGVRTSESDVSGLSVPGKNLIALYLDVDHFQKKSEDQTRIRVDALEGDSVAVFVKGVYSGDQIMREVTLDCLADGCLTLSNDIVATLSSDGTGARLMLKAPGTVTLRASSGYTTAKPLVVAVGKRTPPPPPPAQPSPPPAPASPPSRAEPAGMSHVNVGFDGARRTGDFNDFHACLSVGQEGKVTRVGDTAVALRDTTLSGFIGQLSSCHYDYVIEATGPAGTQTLASGTTAAGQTQSVSFTLAKGQSLRFRVTSRGASATGPCNQPERASDDGSGQFVLEENLCRNTGD